MYQKSFGSWTNQVSFKQQVMKFQVFMLFAEKLGIIRAEEYQANYGLKSV